MFNINLWNIIILPVHLHAYIQRYCIQFRSGVGKVKGCIIILAVIMVTTPVIQRLLIIVF